MRESDSDARCMRASSPRRTRRRYGSVLVLGLGVLICLILFSVHFLQYSLRQKRLGHRLGEHRLMTAPARALAVLALHKLQFSPLLNANTETGGGPLPAMTSPLGPLFEMLARPLDQLADLPESPQTEIDLQDPATVSLAYVVEPLLQPLRQQGTVSGHVFASLRRTDFTECGLSRRGFPREKRGMIRLRVAMRFEKTGTAPIEEEFRFAARVKVTSALSAGLSKFTLYLEKAAPTASANPFYGFNVVQTDEVGDLNPGSPAKPLVLDHDGPTPVPAVSGGPGGTAIPVTFQEFVTSPRGLVYLGGPGQILLNLARTDKTRFGTANSGESFQTFRNSRGEGFTPRHLGTDNLGHQVVVSEMECGSSNSPVPINKSYYDVINSGAFGRAMVGIYHMEYNSIFRLMGVECDRSPTIVLGNVMRHSLLVRKMDVLLPPPGRLFRVLPCLDFPVYQSKIGFEFLPLNEAFGLAAVYTPDYLRYLMEFGSAVASRPYNVGLAFCRDQANHLAFTAFPPGDRLRRLMDSDPCPSEADQHELPEPWKTALAEGFPPSATSGGSSSGDGSDAAGITSLRAMAPFAELLRNSGRECLTLPAEGETGSALELLRRRGLLVGSKLLLNGWVRFKPAVGPIILDQPLEVLGNGGVLLESGDIVIRAALQRSPSGPERRTSALTLATLDGNIILETPAGTNIHASLFAFAPEGSSAGLVRFQAPVAIEGSLAARGLFSSTAEIARFPGGRLQYNPLLAALPNSPDETGSEKPSLSFAFEPLLWSLD